MSTYKLRRLSARIKNAHIRVNDIGWKFADDMTADESKSLAYVATLLSGLYGRVTRRTNETRDPRGAVGKSDAQ